MILLTAFSLRVSLYLNDILEGDRRVTSLYSNGFRIRNAFATARASKNFE